MAKVILVLIAAVLAVSCAGHAPMTQPVAAPVIAEPIPVPPAAAPALAPATPVPPVAASGDASVVPNKDLINHGYRFTQVKGQPMYCRSQPITGSNLRTTVCKSEAQLVCEQQQAQDLTNHVQGESCTDSNGNNHMTSCLH